MSDITTEKASGDPGLASLFFAFLGISLMGFGGVMPWARWMVVEKRGWFTPAEFNDAMALCQFLPGGNIINFGIIVGHRFRGAAGAVAAVTGMMLGPFFLVIALAGLYTRFSALPGVDGALTGLGAAAAGLVTAMTVKMLKPMRGEWVALGLALAGFVAVGIFRLPLYYVVAVIAPLAILYAWRRVS